MTADRWIRWVLKPIVFTICLSPVAWMIWAGLNGQLTADPLKEITHETGDWTLACPREFHANSSAVPPLSAAETLQRIASPGR